METPSAAVTLGVKLPWMDGFAVLFAGNELRAAVTRALGSTPVPSLAGR